MQMGVDMASGPDRTVLGFSMGRKFMGGLDLVESIHATELVQDWSGCRSPSRARRRHARGIKTQLKEFRKPACYRMGGILYAHPEFIRHLGERMQRDVDNRLFAAFNGI